MNENKKINKINKIISTKEKNAILLFSCGKFFIGKSWGADSEAIGEICFNTSYTGYQEIISDPSYAGQIVNFTFPHIGNVGANKIDVESDIVYVKGIIISEPITNPSNWRSQQHFSNWLIEHNISAISNIDTREVTRFVRNYGAKIVLIKKFAPGEEIVIDQLLNKIKDIATLKGQELSHLVSTKKRYKDNREVYALPQYIKNQENNIIKQLKKPKILVIDYGIKNNIIKCLNNVGFEIEILPYDTKFLDFDSDNFQGVFLSNGPGDPEATSKFSTRLIQEILAKNIPMFGICLGHQLLAKACGLKIYKMEQGHRGGNHPVKNLKTGKVEITSQNHGFCVDSSDIPNNVEITHISLFDNSIEGLKIKEKPVFSVQYHPESSPGPHDSYYLFQQFYDLVTL